MSTRYEAEDRTFEGEESVYEMPEGEKQVRMISGFTLIKGGHALELGQNFARSCLYKGVYLIGTVATLATRAGPVAQTGFWDSKCEPVQYVPMRVKIISLHIGNIREFRNGAQLNHDGMGGNSTLLLCDGAPSIEYQDIWSDFADWQVDQGVPLWWPTWHHNWYYVLEAHMLGTLNPDSYVDDGVENAEPWITVD
ncbi:hypothetical protein BDV93DRAFT_559951 [Ceratobasidium sp. AG-I]|nr:hypothetical protein BDV93DRAFT_559951 [Ceratobasidium sp. AG-I]